MTGETTEESPAVRHCLLRRKTIRAQITNFQNFLKGMKDSPDYDHIQVRMESLAKFFDEFRAIQIQLEELQPENDANDKIRDEMEENYCREIGKARALMRKVAPAAGIGSERTSPSATPVPAVANATTIYKKLPELNPPTFDGLLENWATFKARFTCMISQNKHLSDSDRLQYLQSSLTGRAAKVIQSLEMTDSNYEDAWQLLVDKYDNTRKAILRHINILLDLEPIKDDSAESIEELVDTVRQHLRSLKNLGQPNENADGFIVGIITRKISFELTRQWELTLHDNQLPSYTSLIDFLAKRANCSDARAPGTSKPAASKNHPNHKGNKKGSGHQTFNTETRVPECPVCKEKHFIYQCPKFVELAIDARIKAAQQAHFCLNCLRGQHKTKECKSKGRCRTCGNLHNTMLHLIRSEVSAPGSS